MTGETYDNKKQAESVIQSIKCFSKLAKVEETK
jgi:uncharacterized protein YegP (UPF0339 family)